MEVKEKTINFLYNGREITIQCKNNENIFKRFSNKNNGQPKSIKLISVTLFVFHLEISGNSFKVKHSERILLALVIECIPVHQNFHHIHFLF